MPAILNLKNVLVWEDVVTAPSKISALFHADALAIVAMTKKWAFRAIHSPLTLYILLD